MPRIRKKTSKRGTSHQRARIKHKVAESRKKAKKATRKNPHPQWKSKKPKDPGIPNSFPYKAQILAEIAEQRRQEEEERRQRKEQKRAEKAAKSKADEAEEAETEDDVEDTVKADDKHADIDEDSDENEAEDDNSKTLENVDTPAPDSGFTGISSLPAANSAPTSTENENEKKEKKKVTFHKNSALAVVPESSGTTSTSASASASAKRKKERRKRKERTALGKDSSLLPSSANAQAVREANNASTTGDDPKTNADEAAKRRRKRART